VTGLLAVFVLALALRYPVADVPFERDEGEYAYVAQRWLLGEVPYKANFDQKPPAVFVAYAAFLRLFGESPSAVHWGAQLYTLGTLALVVVLGRKLFDLTTGVVAGAVCAVMLVSPCVDGNAANTELFMLLPLAAGALATLRATERDSAAWAAVAGVLGGAALLCKQVALPHVVLFLGWVVWRSRRRWRLAAALALGCVAVPLLASAAFAAAGAGREFYDCTLGYNLAYASRLTPSAYRARLALALGGLAPPFWPALAAAFFWLGPVLFGLMWPAGRSRGGPTLFVLGWLLAALAGASAGGQFFAHYFLPALPPLALLAGASLARLGHPPGARRALPYLLATAFAAYAVWLSPWYFLSADSTAKPQRIYGPGNIFGQSPALARFVAERTRPDEPLFILGSEPQIYFYSRRRCAGRYMFVYPLLTPFADAPDRQREALDDLRRAEPPLVIAVFLVNSTKTFTGTPPDLFDGTKEMLDRSYRVVALVRQGEAGPGELVTGADAARSWADAPAWYVLPPQTPHNPYALAVWEKRSALVTDP
jgi:4-amino-4-deoxy-L-arabinose transferase-like glycosyltransferase